MAATAAIVSKFMANCHYDLNELRDFFLFSVAFSNFRTCHCFSTFVEVPEQDAEIMKIVGVDGCRDSALG